MRRQQAIFDSAIDAIITLNPSGSIESINRAGEAMFGYSAEALLRRHIAQLVALAPLSHLSSPVLAAGPLGRAPRHSPRPRELTAAAGVPEGFGARGSCSARYRGQSGRNRSSAAGSGETELLSLARRS